MRRLFLMILSLLYTAALPAVQDAPFANQLKDHPSPYLALHGNDPIRWQDWGASVLTQARAERRLIFLSSGYFACHWCHVMQRESFQNQQIAAFINRHFIPVKLDRELHPALDGELIEFVRLTRGHAGWPLNVFMTPEGYPLVGLTYSPPESFEAFLSRLQERWQGDPERLDRMARLAANVLNSQTVPEQIAINDSLRSQMHISLITLALASGDQLQGGFGQTSRFPMAPQLSSLLKLQSMHPDARLKEFLELTLDQMASQGLRDHLAGGFFRYTVDPGWQVPHFEKMLYSQALLASLYLQAASVLERPDYLQVASSTLDFTLRELAGRDGGFIAGLSAIDANAVEGGGYLWRESQLIRLLDDQEYRFARQRWGLEGERTTDNGYLPTNITPLAQLAEPGWPLARLQSMEKRVVDKLLAGRQARAHPRDDKQLAAWNGLLLSALIEAAEALKAPRYRQAAEQVRGFLVERLWDGEQLYRAFDGDRPLGSAGLGDYVYVASALYDWSRFSGSIQDRELASQLVAQAWRLFYGERGWRQGAQVALPWMGADAVLDDGPLPSPAARLIRLSLLIGGSTDKSRATEALRISYQPALANPLAYASHAMTVIQGTAGD